MPDESILEFFNSQEIRRNFDGVALGKFVAMMERFL
jgi:hypothetical protein